MNRTELERRSARQYLANYYHMGQWKWDEYDEIWGFAMIPESNPEMMRNLEGLRNRQAGVPDQLEEDELADFYARIQRRKETRDRALGQYAV